MKPAMRKRAREEMARARTALRAAQTLLPHEFYEDAISRAYYAILHAARATLATLEVFPRTHSGLRQMFALHFVKTGILEREYGDILVYEQEDRETCDYDAGARMGKRDAVGAIRDAERFLDRVQEYLASLGIRKTKTTGRP